MPLPPFTVLEPKRGETPVIVEVPHAGLHVPPEHAQSLVAPARALARDADLFCDELYGDAPAEGASMIVAHVSRYVVDLNRGERDTDGDSVQGSVGRTRMPRGLIWRLTTDNERAILGPIPPAELEARLNAIYRPYHSALAALIERKRSVFGLAVVLPGHSMPSVERANPGSPPGDVRNRADLVPGSRGRTSADARFIDLVDGHGRDEGWRVVHDNPYRGGFVTQHYGRPEQSVHCVQVELARRLYLDEATLRRKDGGFNNVRAWCRALVAKLGEEALRG